jgi:hypothetical protein
MKRFLFAAVLMASGCCTVSKESADALAEGWELLRPHTEAGITNDPALSDDSKTTRLRHVGEFTELILEVQRDAR